jgi:hypothetical protein
MKIKETILANGGKILVLTLSPTEARLLSTELPDNPAVMRYWFDAIHNDTEYNVRIEVDWSKGGTIQDK